MKLIKLVLNALKYILWLIFGFLLILFIVGFFKFGGSFQDYVSDLNDKARSDVSQSIELWNPFSWNVLFWTDDSILSGGVVTTGKMLNIDSENEFVISGVDMNQDVDVLDSNFEEEFESFFEDENIENESDIISGQEETTGDFGFVDVDNSSKTGVENKESTLEKMLKNN